MLDLLKSQIFDIKSVLFMRSRYCFRFNDLYGQNLVRLVFAFINLPLLAEILFLFPFKFIESQRAYIPSSLLN